MIDERIIELPNDKFKVLKDDVPDRQESPEFDFSHANNKRKFERLMKWKGLAGWWAYKHGIGLYSRRKLLRNPYETPKQASIRARARYIGQESWYDEDNYFWIKIHEYPKPLICQLRISNHITDFSNYYETHSNEEVGIVNCDSVLNVKVVDKQALINAGKNPLHGWTRMHTTYSNFSGSDWTMFSVEMILDPNDPNVKPEGIKKFEDFISEVQAGNQPTISIDDIKNWVDPKAFVRINRKRVSDDPNDPGFRQLLVRPNQLTKRDNLKPEQWPQKVLDSGKDFGRYLIARWTGEEVPLSEIWDSLDINNPVIIDGEEYYVGQDGYDRIYLNYNKGYFKPATSNGDLNKAATPVMVNINENIMKNRNRLIESFNLSTIYLHNIIMESIEKLL